MGRRSRRHQDPGRRMYRLGTAGQGDQVSGRNPFMRLRKGDAPADAEGIGQLFRTLARRGSAVVVSGHEVSLLNLMADQVTWCTAGTTYELGSPAEAARHERFRAEYLGEEGGEGGGG